MRNFILRLIGYHDVMRSLIAIENAIQSVNFELLKLRSDLAVTYRDEFSKDRQELSQELAEKMLKKLNTEEKARRHTLGEL